MANIQRREGKKGPSYRIRVCIGTDENGNAIMKSKTWTPPHGMKKKDAEKEARRLADEYENMAKMGIRLDDITFRELSDQFLEDRKDEYKPKTLQGYANMLKLINKHLGDVKIRSLRKQHIRDYIEELKKPYYTKSGIEKTRSARTINDYFSVISAVLTYACELDYLEDNICTQKGIKRPRQTEKKDKSIPIDVIRAYIDVMNDAPIPDKAFFFLALYSGARAGEILGLKWEDIDFDNEEISINDNCQYITGRGIIYITPKTSTSERKISLPPAVFSILRQLHTQQMENRLAAGPAWGTTRTNPDADGRLFLNEIGAPIHPDTPRKNLQKIGRRENLPKITVHQLRHTLVSLAIKNGDPVTAIAAFVGHATPRVTTQVYAHEIRKAGEAKKLGTSIDTLLRAAK